MDLSEEMLREVTGFGGLGFAGPKDERRRHQRLPLGKQCIIWPRRDGRDENARTVMVRDVSLGGMSMVSSQALRAGEVFVACLPRQAGRPVMMECVVQWCDPGTGGSRYLMGAVFRRVSESEQPNTDAINP